MSNCFAVVSAPPREKMSTSCWAVRANEITHVLDQPTMSTFTGGTSRSPARILQRNIGWCRDHDRARQWHSLNHESATSPVPGGRSINQIIKQSPLHRSQELLDDRMQHRTAPNQRLSPGLRKPTENDLEPVRVGWHNLPSPITFGCLVGAEHERTFGP